MNKDRECLKAVASLFWRIQEYYESLNWASNDFRQLKDYVDQTLAQPETVETVTEQVTVMPEQLKVDLSGVNARLVNIESALIKLLPVDKVDEKAPEKAPQFSEMAAQGVGQIPALS